MKLKDQKEYDDWKAKQKNDDPMAEAYGMECFYYAERWADLMEAGMEVNPDADFAELAKRTSHEADTDGLTGFMYGMAVGILSKCWVEGELLRRWHNGEYGVKPEDDNGGVVNPAILTIGPKDDS